MRSEATETHLTMGVAFRPTRSFFGSSRPHAGFETDREVFIGRYRSLANPLMVESGRPSNGLAPRGNNIASLWHELDLAPGKSGSWFTYSASPNSQMRSTRSSGVTRTHPR